MAGAQHRQDQGDTLSETALAELRRRLRTCGIVKLAAQLGTSDITLGTLESGGRAKAHVVQRLEARLRGM
jgi:hypothetical protein